MHVFSLHAHKFRYECLDLMCVKVCRHALHPTAYRLDSLLNWPRYAWKCGQIWSSEGPTGSQRMPSDVTEAMRVQTLHVVSVLQFRKPLEGDIFEKMKLVSCKLMVLMRMIMLLMLLVMMMTTKNGRLMRMMMMSMLMLDDDKTLKADTQTSSHR